MPAWKRILIGAIGGLTPVLLMIISIDIAFIIDNAHLTNAHLIGFAIKYVCLAVIGATVAYLHEHISKPLTIFQIGLAAPALLTSIITSNGITSIQREFETLPKLKDMDAALLYSDPRQGVFMLAVNPNPPPDDFKPAENVVPLPLRERLLDAATDVKEALTGEVYEKAVTEPDAKPNPVIESITGEGYREVVPKPPPQPPAPQ